MISIHIVVFNAKKRGSISDDSFIMEIGFFRIPCFGKDQKKKQPKEIF